MRKTLQRKKILSSFQVRLVDFQVDIAHNIFLGFWLLFGAEKIPNP